MTKKRWNNHFSILLTTMLTSAPSSRLIYRSVPLAGCYRSLGRSRRMVQPYGFGPGPMKSSNEAQCSMIEDIETWIDMSRTGRSGHIAPYMSTNRNRISADGWCGGRADRRLNQSKMWRGRFRVISHGDSDDVRCNRGWPSSFRRPACHLQKVHPAHQRHALLQPPDPAWCIWRSSLARLPLSRNGWVRTVELNPQTGAQSDKC